MDSCSGDQRDQDEDEGWDGHKCEQNQNGTDHVREVLAASKCHGAIIIYSHCDYVTSFLHKPVGSHKIDRGNEETGVGEDNES